MTPALGGAALKPPDQSSSQSSQASDLSGVLDEVHYGSSPFNNIARATELYWPYGDVALNACIQLSYRLKVAVYTAEM